MTDNDPMAPQDDEVILCVRYTTFFSWFVGVFLIIVFFYDTPYRPLLCGDYFKAPLAGFTLVVLPLFCIEILFTRYILFYPDRVVKVWYRFGQRTIPYARAKLIVISDRTRYKMWPFLTKGNPEPFTIRETNEKGKVNPMQIPIYYNTGFVDLEMRYRIEGVIGYLVGVENRAKLYEESRAFARTTLPRESLRHLPENCS